MTPSPSKLISGRTIACGEGEAMSDESEVGIVLANAPRLERAFGRKLAALITLVSLYFARRRPGLLRLFTSVVVTIGLALLAWIKAAG
jgi:hypothetical protein